MSVNSEKKSVNYKKEHKRSESLSPSRIYFEQLLCLCLLAVVSYWNSGARVALMAGFSVCGAVIMDMVGCAMSKKTYNPRDLSTLTAGLCIALLMPAGVPYRLVFFGSALTISIKHIFGGKDNYIFNPTAAAFAFLILCYPSTMLLFPKPLDHLPVWGEINPTLLSGLTPIESVSSFNIMMGNITGAMGTVHILVILVIAVCLLLRRSISATVTLTALGANLIFSGILGSEHGLVWSCLSVLVSGYFLFMLVFLVNDPQTLPKTFLGKVYYGLLFAGMTALFRHLGKVEGYPAFALLFVNTMTERSDILAAQTVSGVKRAVIFAQGRLNSYERIREKAETVDEIQLRPALTDTQEIVLDRHEYNMPPVDNKIVKINRKKSGLLLRIKEKLGSLSEKRKLSGKNEPETADINFLENLKEGMRDLGSIFKKKDSSLDIIEQEQDAPIEEIDPIKLAILINEDDVVEIDVKEDRRKKKSKKEKSEEVKK
jgi:electron transport complex protein RnfD